jgi:hypothetical protein
VVQTYAQQVRSRDKAKREKQKLKEWYANLDKQIDAGMERITQQYIGDTNILDDIACVNIHEQENAEFEKSLRKDMLHSRQWYRNDGEARIVACHRAELVPTNRYRSEAEHTHVNDTRIKNWAHSSEHEKFIFQTLLSPEEQQRFYQDIGEWLASIQLGDEYHVS